jgi:probable rRNA maturation factor
VYLCRVELNFNNAPSFLDSKLLRKRIQQIINDYNVSLSHFAFNFVNEDRMLEINQSFLNHDTHTDVITFDYSTEYALSGECYISLDRVVENATKFSQSTENELHRLCIHAVLHCLGYSDQTKEEKEAFRSLENKYLDLFHVKP